MKSPTHNDIELSFWHGMTQNPLLHDNLTGDKNPNLIFSNKALSLEDKRDPMTVLNYSKNSKNEILLNNLIKPYTLHFVWGTGM
jgi:hypothetical protein